MFIQPIYDRSLADALYAKANQLSNVDLKGALNLSDLQRIESNTIYLKNLLISYGYVVTTIDKTDWTNSSYPLLSDIDRIRQNCINLATQYARYETTPTPILGKDNLDYQDINDIEKVLFDINDILIKMIGSFKYCGTFKAGFVRLPIMIDYITVSTIDDMTLLELEQTTVGRL